MKIKSIIALFAISLLWTSCSKENAPELPGNQTGEKGRVRVTIDGSSFSTRATFPGNDPLDKEILIYNYAILVFNENQILEHIEPVTVFSSNNSSTSPKEPNQLPSTEFEVTLGTKYFFVIANVPVSKLMTDQDDFSPDNDVLIQGVRDYILELETVDQIMGYINSGTNVNPNTKNRGFMMTSLGNLITKVIDKNKDDGQVNDIELPLGRAMAKVAVRDNLNPVTQAGLYGTLEDIKYKVGHNPKKIYVIQHFHRYSSNEVLITPNYEDETVDPNAYLGSMEDYQSADDADQTYTYCIENANKIPKMGNASVIYVEGKFIPHVVVDKDKNPGNPSADGTFWRIKNIGADAIIKYEEHFYNEEPDVDPTVQETVKYDEGISYYTLYLANDRTTDDKYTVKRNTFYKVSINKVSTAGEPTDDEDVLIPDPEIPLDGTGIIDATIKIVEWDDIEQGGEL